MDHENAETPAITLALTRMFIELHAYLFIKW
jgi:hypothetical protein